MHPGVCRLLIWIVSLWILSRPSSADIDCDVTYSSTTSKMGNFSTPGYPNHTYPDNKRCVYKFVGLSTERVKIHFNKFRLQGISPDCKFDFIDVYVELSSAGQELLDAPLLGRFCGNNMKDDLPELLISTKNVIVIIFFSDSDKNEMGFSGTYEFIDGAIYNIGKPLSAAGCSFDLDSSIRKRGEIISPTYPGTYPNNLHCKYELHGRPGERVKLTFNDFSLFHGADYCPFDYVLIKDGRSNSYAENIGIFCGKYEKVSVFSSREYLSMEFVTRSGRVSFDEKSLDNIADYKFDRRGFNISYEFSTQFIRFDLKDTPEASHVIGTECDVRIKSTEGSNGTFTSPGYPSDFPKDTVCRYFLDGEWNAGRIEKVKVKFNDFGISGTIGNCHMGSLGVSYEGYRQPNTINERFCGQLWPPPLESRDPRMILHFDTHGATEARFVATYSFIQDWGIDGESIGREGACSFRYKSSEEKSFGYINSPRHPDKYPPSVQCLYIFQLKHNERLLISFDIFSLDKKDDVPTRELLRHPNQPKCLGTFDYLELNQRLDVPVDGRQYGPVQRYCGTKIPAPVMVDREIELRFNAKLGGFQGFKARYEFMPKNDMQRGCVHTINSDGKGGVLKSPRFPLKYEARSFCEWNIIASKPQNRIMIQLETFKVEGKMPIDDGSGCQHAVLRIQKGSEMRELCGTFKDEDLSKQAVVSDGPEEKIQFLTGSNALGFKGFQLTWTEIHISSGACFGFKCRQTGHCISADLKCNDLPNCGPGDESDEICPHRSRSFGPKEEKVQVVHIIIGTSISLFFCVVLIVCGVYHRKKFRPNDRHNMDNSDHMEVRYVAATSASNTTDRLLTRDKSDVSPTNVHTLERTELENENGNGVNHNGDPGISESSVYAHAHPHTHAHDKNSLRNNHSELAHKDQQPSSSTPRAVSAPKIQKVSIV